MNPRKPEPPTASARRGAAMFPPLSTPRMISGPTITIAPNPRTKVRR
jgi:hypothetical protein